MALERNAVAQELGEQVQEPQLLAAVYGNYARLHCDYGSVDDARAAAGKALEITRAISDEQITIQALTALGRLELSLANIDKRSRISTVSPTARCAADTSIRAPGPGPTPSRRSSPAAS